MHACVCVCACSTMERNVIVCVREWTDSPAVSESGEFCVDKTNIAGERSCCENGAVRTGRAGGRPGSEAPPPGRERSCTPRLSAASRQENFVFPSLEQCPNRIQDNVFS